MSLFKRGETWWYQLKVNGQRIRETARTTDRRKALEAEAAHRERLRREVVLGEKPLEVMTLGQAVDRYAEEVVVAKDNLLGSSYTKEAANLALLADAFGKATPLAKINSGAIAAWVAVQRRKDLSDGTIKRRRALLLSVLRRAHRVWNAIASVPLVDTIAYHGQRERVLSLDEEAKLLAAAGFDPDVADFLVALLDTGARRSELLSIEWTDVAEKERTITLRTRKRRKLHTRVIPMSKRLAEVMARRRKSGAARPWPWSADTLAAEGGRKGSRGRGGNTRTDPDRGIYLRTRSDRSIVFDVRLKNASGKLTHIGSWSTKAEAVAGRDAWIAKHRPPAPAGLRQRLQTVLKRAGLDGVGIGAHALRHSAATRWVDGNVPLKTVADLLGHASITTAERYAHTDDAARRRAIEVMDAINDVSAGRASAAPARPVTPRKPRGAVKQ